MDIIIKDICGNISFYGNEHAIVAVKVNNYKLLKSVIDNSDDSFHSLYHLFDNFEDYRTFVNVGDGFVNINTPNDYVNLIRDDKRLVLKR